MLCAQKGTHIHCADNPEKRFKLKNYQKDSHLKCILFVIQKKT